MRPFLNDGLANRCLNHSANYPINTFMHIYDIVTENGLLIHLSLHNGITYILVEDLYTHYFDMKFFTSFEPALEFIQSL